MTVSLPREERLERFSLGFSNVGGVACTGIANALRVMSDVLGSLFSFADIRQVMADRRVQRKALEETKAVFPSLRERIARATETLEETLVSP